MMKRNDGFTLVELIITIAIGSLITLAATTSMLLALRINANSTATIKQQNTTNMLVAVLDKVAQEKQIAVEAGENETYTIKSGEAALLVYDNNTILLNNAPFMEDVTSFHATLIGKDLLSISMTVNNTDYSASVYCRMNSEVGG